MRTIISGSRDLVDYALVLEAVKESHFIISEVVSGGARGIDRLGERWATENNIPIKRFIPQWDRLGRSAGHIRNHAMGDYADALIAVWDGKSPGTRGMIRYARGKGLMVFVKRT